MRFNYFPTPPDVVDRLMELADVRPGMLVLEPEAPGGGNRQRHRTAVGEQTCIELMPANAQALRDQRHSVSERDFLTMQPSPLMDRVVMNPPFARQADIKHVLHALRFLRDGGRLVSVMSASVTFRENRLTQDFRALVSSRSGSIEELPEGAFKSSGTMVRTVIVTIPHDRAHDPIRVPPARRRVERIGVWCAWRRWLHAQKRSNVLKRSQDSRYVFLERA